MVFKGNNTSAPSITLPSSMALPILIASPLKLYPLVTEAKNSSLVGIPESNENNHKVNKGALVMPSDAGKGIRWTVIPAKRIVILRIRIQRSLS
jgi:hypothetical protein